MMFWLELHYVSSDVCTIDSGYFRIGSGYVLVPIRRQAITWNIAGPYLWRDRPYYALCYDLLGVEEHISTYIWTSAHQ